MITNVLKLTTTLLVFALAAPVYAQDKKPVEPSKTGSDKMDLQKLEDKYWASKDDDYKVIQNRTFAKTGKFYGSAVYGILMNDPFAKGRVFGAMFGYYLNEDFGLEFSYLAYNSNKNETVSQFESTQGAAALSPNYNLIKGNKTLSATYTPFYAKMAFMNKAILYFDMGFTLGLGLTDYQQQKVTKDNGTGAKTASNEIVSSPHVEFGIMQQLFLNQHFAFRIDVKNTIYTQKVKQYEITSNIPEGNRTESSKSGNDTTISLGLTVFTK